MTCISTTYKFDGKSDFLKFVDKRNKNIYKLLNGKTYTLISNDDGKNIQEKTLQLNGCKKVVALIKCVVCLPLLAVTIMLKITSKENKLAAARFNRIQLAAKKNASSKTRTHSSTGQSRTVTFTRSSQTVSLSEEADNEGRFAKTYSDGKKIPHSSKKEDSAIRVIDEGKPIKRSSLSASYKEISGSTSMKDDKLSRKESTSQQSTLSDGKGCKIKLTDNDLQKAQAASSPQNSSWLQFPSTLLSVTKALSKDHSSDFKTATTGFSSKEVSVNHSMQQDEISSNKVTAFLTNTVAPAAIKGAYYLTDWAIKQIVKDGLVYGTSALTGIPPEELRYGINIQAAASQY